MDGFRQTMSKWFTDLGYDGKQLVIRNNVHWYNFYIGEDMRAYRQGYPKWKDDKSLIDNYLFWTNQLPYQPDGEFIDDILEEYVGDFSKINRYTFYFDWVTPTADRGPNEYLHVLQRHEIKALRKIPEVYERAFKIMLMFYEFYGLELVDKETGEIEFKPYFKERMTLINDNEFHHYRIARWIKSMGELGLDLYQGPLVRVLMEQVFVEGRLPECAETCYDLWILAVKNIRERDSLVVLAEEYSVKHDDYVRVRRQKHIWRYEIMILRRKVKEERKELAELEAKGEEALKDKSETLEWTKKNLAENINRRRVQIFHKNILIKQEKTIERLGHVRYPPRDRFACTPRFPDEKKEREKYPTGTR
ncbi:opioid growth factor receptor-like protein 1 [Tubulanus polymorphus]|uniref:opioid growth factor receptor-like protein 1 n=1 Tax=Tubulanus polymorphus TaxID=672921 RepID=UPI003DA6CCA3